MAITFIGRIIAPRIEPGTALPYVYTAGEAISAKEVVCKGGSDGRIYQASALSWDDMPVFGVAIQSKNAGEAIQVVQFGQVTNIARTEDFNFDDKIYVSTTPGKVTKNPPSAVGDIIQTVGRAINNSDIILQIEQTVVEIKDL